MASPEGIQSHRKSSPAEAGDAVGGGQLLD